MSSASGPGGKKYIDLGAVMTPPISEPWTVDKVLATMQPAAPAESTESPIPFFHLLERLKTTKREGWRRFGITSGESIADHMNRMAVMTFLCPPTLAPRLDLAKCMKMCVVHDMAEALVGDITPVDGIDKAEKNRREAETMDYISERLLGGVYGGVAGKEMRAVWQEYEDSDTVDSKFVHDLDKVELLCQMLEYEKRADRQLDLGEFEHVATKIVLPECQEWGRQIIKDRADFWGRSVAAACVDGGVNGERRKRQGAHCSDDAAATAATAATNGST